QTEGRLRVAGGGHPLHLEIAERVQARGMPDRLGRLREHVVREAVPGMAERPVARWVHRLERQTDDEDEPTPTLDADELGRYPDPGEAVADELRVSQRPVGCGVQAAAHVEPLDDYGAVELLRVHRPPN